MAKTKATTSATRQARNARSLQRRVELKAKRVAKDAAAHQRNVADPSSAPWAIAQAARRARRAAP